MATCENCKTTFTPSAQTAEVTTTRILCTNCEAERRAEKLRRAAASGAPTAARATQPASTRPAGGVPPPVPATRRPAPSQPAPERTARADSDRASQAAPERAARSDAERAPRADAPETPAARIARASAAASAAPASASRTPAPAERTPAPAERAPAPAAERTPARAERAPAPAERASRSAARADGGERSLPLSSKRAPAREDEEEADEPETRSSSRSSVSKAARADVKREIEMLQRRENKIMTIAWIICAVLLLVAGGVWGMVQVKKSNEAAAIAAHEKAVADFLVEMKAFDLNSEASATKAIEVAEARKDFWKDENISGEVSGIAGRARTNLDSAKEKRELMERLKGAEDVLQNASTQTPDQLAKVRRTIDDLFQRTELLGPEFKTRVDAARIASDRVYAARLHEDAKAQAAKGPSEARAAITAYTRAENEVTTLLDRAVKMKNTEAQEYFKQHFKDIITESDAVSTTLFTPEVIEKTPWKELLSGEQVKNWQNDGLKGFRIENGVLQAVGPDAGGKLGVMSIGDREQWRDFQIEMEFAVEGSVTFFFRLGRRYDTSSESIQLSTVGNEGLKPKTPYTAVATFIGSKWTFAMPNSDIPQRDYDINWTRVRKGAFGVTVPEGAALTISKLRIRELR